jgi:hypothetical protein
VDVDNWRVVSKVARADAGSFTNGAALLKSWQILEQDRQSLLATNVH